MIDHTLDPQRECEVLAEALQRFYAHPAPPPVPAIMAVREAVARATEVWQRCERQRTTSSKAFRAHVVRLKLLLAGVYQTLDILPAMPLPDDRNVNLGDQPRSST